MFGEDEDAAHGINAKVMRWIYKLQQGKSQIDCNLVAKMEYSVIDWTEAFTKILTDEMHLSPILKEQEIKAAQVYVSRLAHTPPERLFGNSIQNETTF